jgi:hypothetical protein
MTLSEKIFDTLWKSNLKCYPEIQRKDDGMIEFAVRFESTDVEFIFCFEMNAFEAQSWIDNSSEELDSSYIVDFDIEEGLNHYWDYIAPQITDWTLDLILNGDLYPGKTKTS